MEKLKIKKSQAGVFIGIIVFLVIVGIIVALIIVVQKSSWFDEPVEIVESPMKLYLKATDELTQEQVSANYSIYVRGTLASRGVLSEYSLTEIELPRNNLEIYCWSNDYYLSRYYKLLSNEELTSNISKSLCHMRKVGNLKISHKGDLSKIENTITFNITADEGWWQKLSVAIAWSSGIIEVYQPGGEAILCEKGLWKNYTEYNASTKEYTWTPTTYYVCGHCENRICEISQRCESVDKNKCVPFSGITPERFIGKVDTIKHIGKELYNQSYELVFNVKTLENKNALDYVEFTFYDNDRRFDPNENLWIYMSEQNGINLGGEDIKYKVNYQP